MRTRERGGEVVMVLRTKLNDVESSLMNVRSWAVRLSGLSEMPGHRSRRCCQASRAVLALSKLYLD